MLPSIDSPAEVIDGEMGTTMKLTRRSLIGIAAALAFAAAGANAGTLKLSEGSWLRLSGDSTLHPFTSTATIMSLDMELSGEALASALGARAPASMTLRIPVEGLKSNSEGLDKNLRKAMKVKGDENKEIVFTLSSYKLLEGGKRIAAAGSLEISGAKKDVTVEGALGLDVGRAVVDGSHELNMSEYGIKPPTMMLGAVKVKDRVVVRFHLELVN